MDTHYAFNVLLSKGFSKEQAEGLVEVVSKVHEEDAAKNYIKSLKSLFKELEYNLTIKFGAMISLFIIILIIALPLLIHR